MKKKAILALALAFVMCLGTKTAYAAPSPTAADTTILVAAVEVDNSVGTVQALDLATLTSANNEARKLVSEIIKSAQSNVSSTVDSDGNLVLSEDGTPLGTSAEPELLAAFEFTPSASVKEELSKKGKAEVTFDVDYVKAGDHIKVLHFVNGAWEIIDPTSVKDGKVTAVFTSFSPIVITKLTPEVAKLDPATKGVNIPVVIAISLIAVAAIAVVFALGNKKKPVKVVKAAKKK